MSNNAVNFRLLSTSGFLGAHSERKCIGYLYAQLNQLERDQISNLAAGGLPCAKNGKHLNRNGSTISRELRRNKNTDGQRNITTLTLCLT